MIEQFVADCQHSTDSNMQAFGAYFSSTYANKADEWALCLRSLEAYTTNMVCESFHNKIKRNPGYMRGQVNRQIYTLLTYL